MWGQNWHYVAEAAGLLGNKLRQTGRERRRRLLSSEGRRHQNSSGNVIKDLNVTGAQLSVTKVRVDRPRLAAGRDPDCEVIAGAVSRGGGNVCSGWVLWFTQRLTVAQRRARKFD